MRAKLWTLLMALFVCVAISSAQAMDRWAALSMLESGNNDRATGTHGEITRFQIRPQFWPGGNPRNSSEALVVAQNLMKRRVAEFERRHGRAPTDFEFYVLWNAPAEVDHPHRIVASRAKRFVNLIQHG